MQKGNRLGEKLKELREKSGLNQTQISKFLGVDQSYVSMCENDERQFSLDALEKLCSLFGCSIKEIMEAEEQVESLNFAFRSKAIENDDLIAIAEINQIALNIRQMQNLLENNKFERKN